MSDLFVKGSDTSEAAARSVSGETMRENILSFVKARGPDGATTDEIEVALDLRHQTASARVFELKEAVLLVDSGIRRQTRSNRKAAVLVASSAL